MRPQTIRSLPGQEEHESRNEGYWMAAVIQICRRQEELAIAGWWPTQTDLDGTEIQHGKLGPPIKRRAPPRRQSSSYAHPCRESHNQGHRKLELPRRVRRVQLHLLRRHIKQWQTTYSLDPNTSPQIHHHQVNDTVSEAKA